MYENNRRYSRPPLGPTNSTAHNNKVPELKMGIQGWSASKGGYRPAQVSRMPVRFLGLGRAELLQQFIPPTNADTLPNRGKLAATFDRILKPPQIFGSHLFQLVCLAVVHAASLTLGVALAHLPFLPTSPPKKKNKKELSSSSALQMPHFAKHWS